MSSYLQSVDKFHKQHWLILVIKWLLITGWGRTEGIKHHQLDEDTLERKLVYAKEYLAALDIVDAGLSHNRGMTMWEIHSVTSFLANRRFHEERLAPVKFVETLAQCLDIVRNVLFCLQFNKEDSNEGEIRRAAVDAEKKLVNGINVFQSMMNIKI